jgi:hypothetical protein
MPGLLQEERERWIDALGGRIRRHVQRLVGLDPSTEIESAVDVTSNGQPPDSEDRDDAPDVSGPAPPRTNQAIEEEP